MLTSKYLQHKETIHNFIWRVLQIGGKQGITFLIFILAAKLLIPNNFGIYNYVLAIVFLLIVFADFGISTATSKYVAEYNVTDKEKLKSVLFNSGTIILGLTIMISLIIISFGKFYLGDKYVYVLYLLPLIFLIPMTSLYDGIYRGLKKFKHLSIISILVGLFSLSFVYLLIKQYGLIGALISQNLFYFILFLALAFGYKEFHFKLNKSVMKEIGKYAFLIGIINFSYFLYTRMDIIILGGYDYIIEIGYYEIINKFLMLLTLPFLIFAQISAPNIVKYFSEGKKTVIILKLKKYIKFAFIFSCIGSILAFFIIFLVIKYFLVEYNHPSILIILPIFLFVFIFQSVASLVGNTFIISTGHAKLNMINLIIFGILNVILGVIFVNYFGFIGIAYSKIIVGITASLSLIFFYYLKISKESALNIK